MAFSFCATVLANVSAASDAASLIVATLPPAAPPARLGATVDAASGTADAPPPTSHRSDSRANFRMRADGSSDRPCSPESTVRTDDLYDDDRGDARGDGRGDRRGDDSDRASSPAAMASHAVRASGPGPGRPNPRGRLPLRRLGADLRLATDGAGPRSGFGGGCGGASGAGSPWLGSRRRARRGAGMSPTMARSSAADGCTANVGTDDDRPARRRTVPRCGGGAPTLRAGCAGRRRAWCGRGTAIAGLARPDVGCDSSVPAATDGALVGAAKDDATLLAEEARDTWATVAVSSWVLSPWFDRAMDVPEAEATDAGASTDATDTGAAAGTTAVWEASAVVTGWETARGTAPNGEVDDAAGTSSRSTVGAWEPRVGLPPQAATTCRLRRRVAGLRGAASSTTGAPVAAAACAAASDGVEVMAG